MQLISRKDAKKEREIPAFAGMTREGDEET
jgi:hypothetical protein